MIKAKFKKAVTLLFCFFIPRKIGSIKKILWFLFSRIFVFFLLLTLIFSIVPVPYSAYMIEKKATSLWQQKNYSIQYQWVSLDKISWKMQMAVIAAEDQKFKDHFGIDLQAIETAIEHNLSSRKTRGASTISQQMVKNLYLCSSRSWLRKGIELPLTLGVEAIWSKARILEVYLNIAEFGKGIFGVEAASQYFFKKHASQLTMREASLLAASLPNPLIFKVNNPRKMMRNKQRWIIHQIYNLGAEEYLKHLK
ncbi:Penicillin-binding protein 1A [Phocoenobacter uteri]|uniref:Biosynthetic peptidoglycan transglycosylase n=1 Tax=Phocoenobacter uteri TaxID=146806 RepID=A0A379CAT3_9PAST|nr:monofunctional biosynthetic peptidoglycan transglycosylase [Phocoenobacter uteri]MDG6882678.1 monofunctional biosynthetic peptidoglycan transglycosylase [Phocoenobacter uteri]SUB58845.1 Penicillin-binding protein 1A [Phocoenobacter uteri]